MGGGGGENGASRALDQDHDQYKSKLNFEQIVSPARPQSLAPRRAGAAASCRWRSRPPPPAGEEEEKSGRGGGGGRRRGEEEGRG